MNKTFQWQWWCFKVHYYEIQVSKVYTLLNSHNLLRFTLLLITWIKNFANLLFKSHWPYIMFIKVIKNDDIVDLCISGNWSYHVFKRFTCLTIQLCNGTLSNYLHQNLWLNNLDILSNNITLTYFLITLIHSLITLTHFLMPLIVLVSSVRTFSSSLM